MEYLSLHAANALLAAIRTSHFYALTGPTETFERLVALRFLCSPNSTVTKQIDVTLELQHWEAIDPWAEERQEPPTPEHGAKTLIRPFPSKLLPPPEDDEEPYYYLIPGAATGLSDWQFRPYDNDPYPSVPHGHWKGQSVPKLDPYQGWIYERTKQLRREVRWKLVRLWNDKTFRSFAQVAIRHHLSAHATTTAWRVPNPLKLPRKR
jgi:hypothetical protein